ncbi:MAG TPA: fatty acid--CoA ligase family protein [Gemmataceae bacterium]|nr:fatty acid--CoA ligase family protein [Gemmataceae bacterium]
MRLPCASFPSLRDAIDAGETPSAHWIGAEHRIALGDLLRGSAITSGAEDLRGRSVLIASSDPFLVALALIELDGLVRRITLYPPDLTLKHLAYVMRFAEVDAVVSDGRFLSGASIGAAQHALCTPRLVSRLPAGQERLPTEWVLLTSGTTGRPKMVLHTLATLTPTPLSQGEGWGVRMANASHTGVIWGTFYDIRRYGGLQIYLRAVLTRSSLLLTGPQEPVASFLRRAGEAGVTHISGTPSHWRRALMSLEAGCIAPRYIRLSGEIADQGILNSLHSFYPDAEISHAFATTEAGVAFDVRDGLSGFPTRMLTDTSGVDLKVVDATLRIRSGRTAQRYLGEHPAALKDSEGFVDTGDVLQLRDGRYHFQGRRDGVINVGGLKVYPEEVEAVLNRHPQVRLSLVKSKKNPITGALVVAEVLLKAPYPPEGEQARELQQAIKRFCRELLAPHQVPTAIRFVPALAISETGKLVRHHA